jgi:hypothetical protein
MIFGDSYGQLRALRPKQTRVVFLLIRLKTNAVLYENIEQHAVELFPRVNFIVTNLWWKYRNMVRFYNKPDTAYNLGGFLRRPALPRPAKTRSLRTRCEKLKKLELIFVLSNISNS